MNKIKQFFKNFFFGKEEVRIKSPEIRKFKDVHCLDNVIIYDKRQKFIYPDGWIFSKDDHEIRVISHGNDDKLLYEFIFNYNSEEECIASNKDNIYLLLNLKDLQHV